MLTENQKIGLAAGGALIAGALGVIITKQVMAKSAGARLGSGASPVVSYVTPVMSKALVPGTPGNPNLYLIAGPIGQATRAQIEANATAGGLSLIYFGGGTGGIPSGAWPDEMPLPTAMAQSDMYVMGGAYTGAAATLIDPNTVVYLIRTSATVLPGVPAVTMFKGIPIAVIPYGTSGLFAGNAPQCQTANGPSLPNSISNGPQLAIGSSVQEVVTKLQNFLTKQGCTGPLNA